MLVYNNFKFNYNYSIKFLLINKINYFNHVYDLPFINQINLLFYLNDILNNNVNKSSNLSYMYLLKFFCGISGKVVYFNTSYDFGEIKNNFIIKLSLNKNNLFRFFFFFINDLQENLEFRLRSTVYNNHIYKLNLIVTDINIFSEKKNNAILFDLNNELNIEFLFKGGDVVSQKILLNSLKFDRIF